MKSTTGKFLALATLIVPAISQSSSCSTTLTPTNSVKPSIASGYRYALVATGLATPRGIQFDKQGNLLVIETKNGNGSVSVLDLKDNGGTCVSVTSKTTLATDSVRPSDVFLLLHSGIHFGLRTERNQEASTAKSDICFS